MPYYLLRCSKSRLLSKYSSCLRVSLMVSENVMRWSLLARDGRLCRDQQEVQRYELSRAGRRAFFLSIFRETWLQRAADVGPLFNPHENPHPHPFAKLPFDPVPGISCPGSSPSGTKRKSDIAQPKPMEAGHAAGREGAGRADIHARLCRR